jgi:hypothetical protein
LTVAPHELEGFASDSGRVVAWVRVDQLVADEDQTLYLYFGNPVAAAQESPAAVWSNGFHAVWHLSDDPSVAAGAIEDSRNTHAATALGMGAGAQTAGLIGGSLTFDESNDYISVPDFGYGPSFTISMWVRIDDTTGSAYRYLYSHGPYRGQNSVSMLIPEEGVSRPYASTSFCMLDSDDAGDCGTLTYTGTYLDDWDWHHLALRVNGSGSELFVDGYSDFSQPWGGDAIDPPGAINIGRRNDGNTGRYFGGSLDEVRISSAGRSDAWIATAYENQVAPAAFAAGVGTEPACTP